MNDRKNARRPSQARRSILEAGRDVPRAARSQCRRIIDDSCLGSRRQKILLLLSPTDRGPGIKKISISTMKEHSVTCSLSLSLFLSSNTIRAKERYCYCYELCYQLHTL